MIKAAIVDADAKSIDNLKEILVRYGNENGIKFNIFVFFSGIDFISDYTAEYDIVFMEVELPHLDGIQTAKKLRELDSGISLIYVTKHSKYAIYGYEVGARQFLLKPLDYSTFKEKLKSEFDRLKTIDKPFLIINSKENKRKVYHSDIRYITVRGRYVMLHTKSEVIEMRVSMKELEKILEGSTFVRGDNSSMVNLMFVTSVNAEGAMVGDELIPCSRNRRKALIDAFVAYMS